MDLPRQQVIAKVFFTKYKNTLGPQVIAFIEDILDKHNILDENVAESIEHLAKEYNRQDDAEMVVRLDVLERVYEAMQNAQPGSTEQNGVLDVESHLQFIDAFEMPSWHWSVERNGFERLALPSFYWLCDGASNPMYRNASKLNLSGSAESRVLALRDRFSIIKQAVLRNENFSPRPFRTANQETTLKLSSTKDLLGRAGLEFLLLGMLMRNQEGHLCLEDLDGTVKLQFLNEAHTSEGYFFEGCFVLIEGIYSDEEIISVNAIGHPPCERRIQTRSLYGHVDFLGRGVTSVLEDDRLDVQLMEHTQLTFFVLSDVWLDHPRTMVGLRKLFRSCIDNNWLPRVFIMCGNFSSKGVSKGNPKTIVAYQEGFDALSELILSFPLIERTCHFVFVPGPQDLCPSALLPQRPILQSFTHRLERLSKVVFLSNPCRIKFFGQEIVIFRDDMMARVLRNLINVKPETDPETLKRFLVQTIVDQGHLSPLLNQPILSEHDAALRLYPIPTTLILADKYDRYEFTYEGCHVFNPGSFLGASYGFSTYYPATCRSEPS